MLVPNIHLLSFSPQILPNRLTRIPYTRQVFKLLQKSDQVFALPYQRSLEKSSQIGNAPGQHEGFKPKSWAVSAQPPVLGVVNNHMAGHSRPRHYSLKDNSNYKKHRCSWAGFCSGCYEKAIPLPPPQKRAPSPHCDYSCEASVFVLNQKPKPN